MPFGPFTRLVAAGFVLAVVATPAPAADTYQANLGSMPPSTMLQEVHRSQTGQAVYVFALPKQR